MFYEYCLNESPAPEYVSGMTVEEYMQKNNLNPDDFEQVPLAESSIGNPNLFRSLPLSLLPYSEQIAKGVEEKTMESAEKMIACAAVKLEHAIAVIESLREGEYFPTATIANPLGGSKYLCKIWGRAIVPKNRTGR